MPRNVRHALELDTLHGDTKKRDVMQAELSALHKLNVFYPLKKGEMPPADNKRVPLLWVFTVKPNGTHKA